MPERSSGGKKYGGLSGDTRADRFETVNINYFVL